MSRFKSLVSGLSESSPQIKGTLESWGRELNELRANPVGNERRMKELSDNIKSTVEANAKRGEAKAGSILKEGSQKTLANSPELIQSEKFGNIQVNPKPSQQDEIMKKAAGFGVAPAAGVGMQNPVDMLKEGYNKFESARGKVSDALANQVTGYLPQVSKEKSIDQARAVMDTATDPLSYVGGVGAVDAALGATSALPQIDEETKSRFKSLFGGDQ